MIRKLRLLFVLSLGATSGGFSHANSWENFTFRTVPPLALANRSIEASNHIGLDLAQQASKLELSQTGEIRNQMYSPLSLYNSLGMLQLGVSGAVQQNLTDRLGWADTELTLIHQSNRLLNMHYSSAGSTPAVPAGPVAARLVIANSAWATSGLTTGKPFVFDPGYLDQLKRLYSADVNPFVDFKNPSAAETMNQWASEKTNGLLQEVMRPEILQDLVWVLMNATTIEASWKKKFTVLSADIAPSFQTISGDVKVVPMISAKQEIAAVDIGRFLIAEIPFYSSDLAFFVVVPRTANDFKSWVQNGDVLNSGFWKSTFAQLSKTHYEEVKVTMPKFTFSSSVHLKKEEPLTEQMGLSFLFDEQNHRDFATLGMAGTLPTVVGVIKQDQRIELDEHGLKAAAVTVLDGIEVTSMPTEPLSELIIDRPFFFAIGSKTTGVLLFVGAVADPTSN